MILKYLINKTTITAMVVSLLSPLVLFVPSASAAPDTCTWVGAGADNNFSTAANWTGCDNGNVPENGDTLSFDVTNADTNPTIVNNDFASLDIAGIDITGTNAGFNNYVWTGNAFTLTGNITGDNTNSIMWIQTDITFGSNVTLSAPAGAVWLGNSDGSNTLDMSTFNLDITSPYVACLGLNIFSSLSGSGDVTSQTGATFINLYTDQTSFSGNVTISGSGLVVNPANAIPAGSTVTVNGSAVIALQTVLDQTYPFDLVMNSSAARAVLADRNSPFACAGGGGEQSTTTLSGSLTINSDTEFSLYNNFTLTGTYTSNGNAVTVASGSQGVLTLPGITPIESPVVTSTIGSSDVSSAYLGISKNQTTILNGERGYVTVSNGGTLKGKGTTGDLTINTGGILAPGESPGCLSSGNLILSGTYQVEIQGTTKCTQYDQTDVTGTVDVTGATLNVSFLSGFVPALNDAFTIINNDGADAVTGTFTGMADGSTFVVAGVTFQINYGGGDGNDVVLTATAVPVVAPTAPDTGAGSLITSPLTTLFAAMAVVGVVGAIRYSEIKKTRR